MINNCPYYTFLRLNTLFWLIPKKRGQFNTYQIAKYIHNFLEHYGENRGQSGGAFSEAWRQNILCLRWSHANFSPLLAMLVVLLDPLVYPGTCLHLRLRRPFHVIGLLHKRTYMRRPGQQDIEPRNRLE